MHFKMLQDRQLEEAAVLMENAGNLQAAQETASREEQLLASLSEAQSSAENLKRLHEASQKQLFNMQSRSEEEQVLLITSLFANQSAWLGKRCLKRLCLSLLSCLTRC